MWARRSESAGGASCSSTSTRRGRSPPASVSTRRRSTARSTTCSAPRARTWPAPSTGRDLAPANIDLAAAEIELVSEPGREQILNGKLEGVADSYEYILIDCPPSLSLLTLNALTAARGVIIPVQTQYFALRGMELLFATVEKVQARLNRKLKVTGSLPTMFDARTTHGREVLEELRETYGAQLFETVIPFTVKLADSTMAARSIMSFHKQSPAAAVYRALAEEVENREH